MDPRARYAPPLAPAPEDEPGHPEAARAYRAAALMIASLFSPLGACWLAWSNARWLRAGAGARWAAVALGLLATGAQLFIGAQVPGGDPLTQLVARAPCGPVAGLLAVVFQWPLLRRHEAAGGRFRSLWAGAVAGTTGFGATLVLSAIVDVLWSMSRLA